ncbi:MAG TPA: M56 family metallopeptidase [Gemmataceae bacterium]|nr:M56 family metallopeptidase [Gemmataceae bacterium]
MAWHTPVWYWLAHAALGSFVVLALGALAVRLCREPARRIRLIELTLLGCLLVPWLSRLPGTARWSLGWLGAPPTEDVEPAALDAGPVGGGGGEVRAAVLEPDVPRVAGPTERPAVLRPDNATPQAMAAPAETAPTPLGAWFSLPLLVVGLYVALSGFFLLRWLVGVGQLLRLCRLGTTPPPGVVLLFRAVAGPAAGRVRLLASDRVRLPIMFSWWRPVIVLPADLCRDSEAAALRCCLAHEWSHVERHDAWTWHLASLVGLLFFYQPLFWWLRRQLRLCQDFLADARAAEQADAAEDYAEYLVRVARRCVRGPAAFALGLGGRRSNLSRRILMLIDNDRPLERRCRPVWSLAAGLAVAVLLCAVSAVRLDAGDTPPAKKDTKESKKEDKKDTPAAPAKGEKLEYGGRVTDKETGKPIEGATVTVRRSLLGDKRYPGENKILEESKHKTDAAGKYHFTIPAEQSAERSLYIELDVEHPDYAPKAGFGYALGMIRKNEKLGGQPFFAHVELWPGKPVTGTLETPDGKPAAGVKVLAYSRTTKKTEGFEYGSFATAVTDAKGKFRLVMTTPGEAIFWILPKEFAPSTHKMTKSQRGDVGKFVLKTGMRLKGKVVDAKGKAMPNVSVNIERANVPEDEQVQMVGDHIGRAAVTDAKGEFTMGPLMPGEYRIYPAEHHRDPSDLKYDRRVRPLSAVFLRQRLVLKEGEEPGAVEVRAVPHVVIEAQHFDSKGKKTRGHEFHLFGRIDGDFWWTEGKQDADGKVTAKVPHGLEQTRLNLSTNEHGVLRHRKTKNEPLSNNREIDLGTVNADVKGIEIIRYTAPIAVVKVVARDGGKLKGVAVTATYPEGRGDPRRKAIVGGGRQSDLHFEKQEDGRFRTSQMHPDEDVTITAYADGYESGSEKVKLAEGMQKEIVITLEKSK